MKQQHLLTRFRPLLLLLIILAAISAACTPASNELSPISELPTAEVLPTPTLMPTDAVAASEAVAEPTDAPTTAPTEPAATEPVPTAEPTITPLPPAETNTGDIVPLGFLRRELYLHTLTDANGTLAASEANPVTLTLDGGLINGNAGCNNFSGAMTITNGAVSIGQLASTRMACAPKVMDLEMRLLAALQLASNLDVVDGTMLFTHSTGVIEFRPIPPTTTSISDDSRASAEVNLNADDEKPLAMVDSFDIVLLESFPVQARLTARGNFSDGCGAIGKVEQDYVSPDQLYVTLELAPVDADSVCTMAIVPFEYVVDLDILGLKAGEYRVTVNGVEGSLRLDVDNKVEE